MSAAGVRDTMTRLRLSVLGVVSSNESYEYITTGNEEGPGYEVHARICAWNQWTIDEFYVGHGCGEDLLC